jgi:TetR/AcrR family transcriptional regulator, ethionamide resistance regulator
MRVAREQSRARIVAAATELVRGRAYAELSVEDVMREAGLARTIFYRHFADLADLIGQAGREAGNELFEAERALASLVRPGDQLIRIGEVIATAVAAFERHGPLLRAIAEAAAADTRLAGGLAAIRRGFDEIAAEALAGLPAFAGADPQTAAEVAHALNLMNEAYLLDAFGREPRVDPRRAQETLTAIWSAVLER